MTGDSVNQADTRPFDIQVNGYAGVDFCSADLTAQQLQTACEALSRDGADTILATLITDSIDNLCEKLRTFVRLRDDVPLAKQLIAGFHVEGPFLNGLPGFIGAHPPEAVCAATIDDSKRLLDAGSGLIRLVTLAPESDVGFRTTTFLAEQDVTVSAGHCDPSIEQLKGAIDHGLSMVTHFGNGCPIELPRHDNFLQRALYLRDRLWFCFIPDGAHIPFYALQNYIDLVGLDRTVMVTDAISAATLGSGMHEISGMQVEVDQNGVARKPDSRNLAGSTITLPGIRSNLLDQLGMTSLEIEMVLDHNPRKAIELL